MFYCECAYNDASLYVAIVSFFVASITLIFTIITLNWFKNDRKNQNKKEFSNDVIYKNLQDISFYILNIIKIHAGHEYVDLKELDEAQKRIVIGQTYLVLYANTHKLPYLKEFSEVQKNPKDPDKLFMNNFFKLNGSFIKYRNEMEGKPYNSDQKLDDYQDILCRYLQLAMDYSKSVLYLEKLDPENSAVINYYNELKKIIEDSRNKKLIPKEGIHGK